MVVAVEADVEADDAELDAFDSEVEAADADEAAAVAEFAAFVAEVAAAEACAAAPDTSTIFVVLDDEATAASSAKVVVADADANPCTICTSPLDRVIKSKFL